MTKLVTMHINATKVFRFLQKPLVNCHWPNFDRIETPERQDTSSLQSTYVLTSSERQCCWTKRTMTQKVIIVLMGILSISAIVSISIALSATKKVCKTKVCLEAASQLSQSIDLSVDPCEDFYAFCCNGWMQKNQIPNDTRSFSVTNKLSRSMDYSLRALVERASIQDQDSFSLRNVIYYYNSCMNTSQIDSYNGSSAISLLRDIGGWPILDGDQWNSTDYSWFKQVARVISQLGLPLIIKIAIGADQRNTRFNILQIDSASLALSKDMAADKTIVEGYKKAIISAAVVLGSPLGHERLKEEVDELVDFEYQLAERYSKAYDSSNFMTLAALQNKIPNINWLEFLQLATNETLEKVQNPIHKFEPIQVFDEHYLKNVTAYLESVNPRQIANYIGWRVIYPRLLLLPEVARDALHNFSALISGSSERAERWRICMNFVRSGMSYALTNLFAKENYSPKAKAETEDMVEQLKSVFTSLLESNEWMDEETRKGALKKIKEMKELIGYPSWVFNKAELEKYYEALDVEKNNLINDPFRTEALVSKFQGNRILTTLRIPNERDQWTSNPLIINAKYSASKNAIEFAAAILLPPMYEYNRPQYMNFGAIGSVIGHEITHGFDDSGRHRDWEGNRKDWWSRSSSATFNEKTKCFIEQYKSYGVNGDQTLTENIADNGGLKESYLAYKSWADKHEAEERLPGLEKFTPEQMFFISYGTMWCINQSEDAYMWTLKYDKHSPPMYRALGPVSNSRGFAKAFNCKKGQKMKSENICEIW